MDTLFDFSSFIIQAINFAIVALVLRSFLFKPYMAYLEIEAQKREQLEKQLSDADMILSQAKTESEGIIAHAKKEAKIMWWEIVENAKKEASDVLAGANAEAEAARNKGFAQVELERKNMTEELKWKVLDIALKLNEKLFDKNDANIEFLKKNATGVDF